MVGAGYTGLWTAHHLLAQSPGLRVAVLEREAVGYGASGRNGGWCSALFAASWRRVAAGRGAGAAEAMRRALIETVDEVGRWCTANSVAADYAKGGTLTLARNPAQLQRLQALLADEQRWGATEADLCWLDAATAQRRVRATGVLGALYTPHCAAVHPAKLVHGLAAVVEGQGARIYERTPALSLQPGRVRTPSGILRAGTVVRATEGYTAGLPGCRRVLVPLWSLVIATEPVDDGTWSELGWRERETLADGRHLIVYGQRTADGRIVFGGRGAPYQFGSGTRERNGSLQPTWQHLQRELTVLFPQLSGVRITHRWGGVVGVPRDWYPSVGLDRSTGLAWAGGYVGDGVACSNLAGRTLADLILGRQSELTALPWVQHRWRRWEPEPVRWLAVRGLTRLMGSADAAEGRTGRPARRAAAVAGLIGH